MKPLVLLLSTYPIKDPRHGGQVRLANIAKAYSANGLQVSSMAVYEPGAYDAEALGSQDIPFPLQSPYRKYRDNHDATLINDVLAGIYIAADDGGFPEACAKLPAHIDVIHVEQPWLWPLAKKIKKIKAYKNSLIVYGSQNVEAPLREEILKSYNAEAIDDIVAQINTLEKEAACEADISVAVTPSDLNTLIAWGARHALLAPNGIAAWQAKPEAIERWKACLPKAPWALYVASAHPPNFTGFAQCIGESLGCVPPNSKLVVAGSVSVHIQSQLAATRWDSLNLSRLQLLGTLPDEDLAAVKTLAHAFLLPIPNGGGSNIKTAEALYSGAYVIGTEAAFRGFENFIDLPEVTIVKTSAQMQAAIRNVLTRPPVTVAVRESRQTLLWDRCLAPLSMAVTAALNNKGMVLHE